MITEFYEAMSVKQIPAVIDRVHRLRVHFCVNAGDNARPDIIATQNATNIYCE